MKRPLFAVKTAPQRLQALLLLILAITPVLCYNTAHALSDVQSGIISQNCAHLKQSLKSLQKADSRTRVHLGTTYQNILTNYITPLNLRLVRNDQPNTELTRLQTEFSTAREGFAQKFIRYSQSLEALIATDCKSQPDLFYTRLESTRALRHTVSASVARLDQLLSEHITAVTNFKEQL
ncbi:hypothetical protein IKF76_00520 [Candidatus Saccharibacteria bacterium]|nr:hypothetical protein [Candidatus Saccharibacteria bacterium]